MDTHQDGHRENEAPHADPSARMSLSPGERRWLIVIGVLYAAVVIPIGVHKGGDFTQELRQSERLLHGFPLYDATPGKGVWWPPFTALGLVPFALLARWSLAAAKAGGALLNVFCLGWSVALARRWTTGWTSIALAVAAVAKPLQSNFEHLNITPILLALVVAAAVDVEDRREVRAGAWLGLAAAIKGFPVFALLYFVFTGRWRGLVAGVVVAGTLTLGAMLPYGPAGALGAVLDWVRLSREGAAVGTLGTQSLAGFAFFFGWTPAAVAGAAALCIAGLWVALRRRPEPPAPYGMGLAAELAVLLSPVAWLYYHTLAFLAWVAVLARRRPFPLWARVLLGAAGILTSGVLTFDLYPRWLWFIGSANYAWGGLLLVGVLVIERVRAPVSSSR